MPLIVLEVSADDRAGSKKKLDVQPLLVTKFFRVNIF